MGVALLMDAMTLNLAATALVLFVLGHVLAADERRRLLPFGGYAILALVVGAIGLLRAGVALEDWTLVFGAAFALGCYVGAPSEPGRARLGAAAGVAYAAVLLVLAAHHRWWHGPVGLLLVLMVGVVRQAIFAIRAWRGRSTVE